MSNSSHENRDESGAESFSAEIDAICDRFEAAWKVGERPRIEDYFLPQADTLAQRQLLVELVKLDLGYRWQRASDRDAATIEHDATPGGEPSRLSWKPRLEEYLSCYPELGPPTDLPVSLIATEYRTRLLAGDRPQREDYLARFPEQRDELNELLARMGNEGTTGPQPAEPGWQPGTRVKYFGDYELLEEIARGGMGVVYKARQRSLNRIVALKMILAGQLAGEQDVQRFHAEAEAAAILDHPGIVPIYEVGEHEGQHFFSMGYVEGESLARRLASGPLAAKEAAELIVAVAEAVAYAHGKGVIHRDLKPANILLDCQGRPRITDFGLAKRVSGEAGLTATGQVLGTPSYMPPEQASGRLEQIKETADVYALGATLYALLTGRPPFQAANPMDTLLQVIGAEPVSLRQLNAKLSRDLETICQKCLEKEPRRRYTTAKELADELQRYLDGKPIQARRIGRAARAWRWCKRNPVVAGLASAIVLSLLLGTAVSSYFATTATAQRNRADANATTAAQKAQDAEEAKRKAERQFALSCIDRGVDELERGDGSKGLALLGQAYRAADGASDVALRRSIRSLLGAWGATGPRKLMHDGAVRRAAFSRDGTKVVTAGLDHTIRSWDAATGRPLAAPVTFDKTETPLAFSPDLTRLATLADSQGIRLWDVATGKTLFGDRLEYGGEWNGVAFSPDGTKLAAAGGDNKVRLWSAATGKPLVEPLQHDVAVDHLAFSADGTKLLARGRGTRSEYQGEVRLWDVATRKPLGEAMQCDGSLRSAVFSADGTKLATAGGFSLDGHDKSKDEVRVWDVRTGKPSGKPMVHDRPVDALAFSPDGATLVTGTRMVSGSDASNCGAQLWDTATGNLIGDPMKHYGSLTAAAFSPDGARLATVTVCHAVYLWDVATRRPLGEPLDQDYIVLAVGFSPDGKKLATVISPGPIGKSESRLWESPISLLWDPATGKLLQRVTRDKSSMPGAPTAPAGGKTREEYWDPVTAVFSRDTTKYITAFRNQTELAGMQLKVRLWDTMTGEPLGKLIACNEFMGKIALSLDGTKLATAFGAVRLWDTASGKELGSLVNYDRASAVAFSPDGTKLATVGNQSVERGESEARLWDAATGKPLVRWCEKSAKGIR